MPDQPRTDSRFRSRILPLGMLILLVLTGIGTRRAFLVSQPGGGASLPFTLESALHYRRIREIFLGNGLPAIDRMIQAPEGIRTFETDTVGSEFVVAAAARRMPDLMILPERVRWIHVVWYCLGIAWLTLWVWRAAGSWAGAWAAGAFYSVSMASVSRSTGAELSHENVALPFLLAHLALDAAALHGDRRGSRIASRIGAVLCLVLAQATWDMIQYYVALRGLFFLLDAVRGRRHPWTGPGAWLPEMAALGMLGWIHPYFRAHNFILSPALGLYGACALFSILPFGRLRRFWPGLAVAGMALAFLPARIGDYGERYGHFGRLLIAKIRFLNVKPEDPALLDFYQRLMWTPALHSATPTIVFRLLPALLLLTLILLGVHCVSGIRSRSASDPNGLAQGFAKDKRVHFYALISSLFFVFFVRFHVYAALFLSASAGMLAAGLWRRGGTRGRVCAVAVLIGLGIEAANTWGRVGRWGRNAPFVELRELTDWMKNNAPGEPVLASFGLSSYLLTYANSPILLHPKFETAEIRNRVKQYGMFLFRDTEDRFADWALEQGARIFVYGRGEFSGRQPEYQMRYIVGALQPPMDAPARKFEWAPWRLSRFQLLWRSRRYSVFRILSVSPSEEADSAAEPVGENRL